MEVFMKNKNGKWQCSMLECNQKYKFIQGFCI